MNAVKLKCGCLVERDTERVVHMCPPCRTAICRVPRDSGGEISAGDRQALRDVGRGHLVRP